ncbi:MAG: hypothetical protein HC772_08995 [Leptolyngbyaceae cyanobacterium CRU_2_3]|nr:hypothetical protein [Leptolyngbyaceae cyanobacterium CRU_2_3]
MKRTGQIVWMTGLLLLWLFCSGLAQADGLVVRPASPLEIRLSQFPNWQGKPPVQASRGDLIYPNWFEGNWRVTTTLLEMVAPLAPETTTPGFEGNRQYLNRPIAFNVHFVEAQSKGLDSLLSLILNRGEKQIVSDRAFNGMSLSKAYLGDRVIAVKVDPNNPNRQITLLQGDSPVGLFSERQLVSTVIGRSTATPNPDQFLTSEVFQQEFRGTPQIYFNEVENTTAYLHQATRDSPDQPEITAEQVTAIYLSPQDPDYFETVTNGSFLGEPHPVALYRYRLEFFRDETLPGMNDRDYP